MGLLEKAYEYKKEINRKGRMTLIDTIEGPAETEMTDEYLNNTPENNDHQDIEFTLEEDSEENEDLFQLPEDDNYSPLDALNEQKAKQKNADISDYDLNIEDTNSSETYINADTSSNPLTAEDEPTIPADIENIDLNIEDNYFNNKNNLDSNMDNKKIPVIEPNIFEEEHLQTDNESTNNQVYPKSNPEEFAADRNSNTPDINEEKYLTQYEIKKEISKSETKKTLFEVVIFSVMGQIVTSSASILVKNDENKWIIANSSGLKSGDRSKVHDSASGIMKYLKKDIIDIEKFKNDPDCNKQYNDLNSINAKLLFPWTYKNEILGIIALGNKITDENYTAEEKEIIQSICDAAAIEFKKLDTIEKLKAEVENVQSMLSFSHQMNSLQEKINTSNSLKSIKDIIKPAFDEIGIISYSVFLNDSSKEKYTSIINEDEGVLSDNEKVFNIDESNPFISFIKTKKANPRIEDYDRSDIIKKIFTETQINKMSVLWIYPFEIGNILIGFLTIFKVKETLLNEGNKDEVNDRLKKLSGTLLSSILNIVKTDPDRNRYIDYTEEIFIKINKELENSKKLNIPITLIVFSIKNFKRYQIMFGFEKSSALINNFSKLIINRLSETDFSARYDRNKIIVLLPGKDKKFGTTFANTIRNEFMQKFKKNEMQLLVTFLLSESPDDGNDLNSFTDNID